MTRPDLMLQGVEQAYPYLWEAVGNFLDDREEVDWPDWCFLPMAGSYSIVSGGAHRRIATIEGMTKMQLLSAVIPWRMTKGVYRFDVTLLEELWQTPIAKELPVEILFRMPEWCIYVDTAGRSVGNKSAHGFFAYLEYDVEARRAELRLFVDLVDMPLPMAIHLDHASLTDCLAQTHAEAERQAKFRIVGLQEAIPTTAGVVEPLLSLLLYICSQNADIQGIGDKAPRMPKVKRLSSFTPPPQSRKWDVGLRIGAALRRAAERGDATGAGAGAPRRMHVRRAHWHTYWTGPREQQIPQLRWLSPILVNADEDDLPTTIRDVK